MNCPLLEKLLYCAMGGAAGLIYGCIMGWPYCICPGLFMAGGYAMGTWPIRGEANDCAELECIIL